MKIMNKLEGVSTLHPVANTDPQPQTDRRSLCQSGAPPGGFLEGRTVPAAWGVEAGADPQHTAVLPGQVGLDEPLSMKHPSELCWMLQPPWRRHEPLLSGITCLGNFLWFDGLIGGPLRFSQKAKRVWNIWLFCDHNCIWPLCWPRMS